MVPFKLTNRVWLNLSGMRSSHQLEKQPPLEFSVSAVELAFFGNKILSEARERRLVPFSLSEIYQFDDLMKRSLLKARSLPLVVCAGAEPVQQVAIAFLLGCHLIMSQGHAFEEVVLALRPIQVIHDKINQDIGALGGLAFNITLRAMCCAKCLEWIDFRKCSDGDEPSTINCPIEMDEYLHYSRHVVPMFFP
jgi:hypothetical protein